MGSEIGEFDLIDRYFRPLASHPAAQDLKDDAAVLKIPDGFELVISKDMLVADVHFFASDPADKIAKKALRTNISDIISKGAKPIGYSLGLALPDTFRDQLPEFCLGLQEDQDLYGISLLGGDTTRSKAGLVISITMYGFAETDRAITRMGARDGDMLYVSGEIGSAGLGLKLALEPSQFSALPHKHRNFLTDAFLLPKPPLQLRETIAKFASASMDVSDGLVADVTHLCDASGVTCTIDLDCVPMSSAAKSALDVTPYSIEDLITAGDDYQCLFTIPPSRLTTFVEHVEKNALEVSQIGSVSADSGTGLVFLKNNTPVQLNESGYTHF